MGQEMPTFWARPGRVISPSPPGPSTRRPTASRSARCSPASSPHCSPAAPVTTADGFDRLFNGGAADAYVAKLNATGSALLYATFLGGSQGEGCADVALDLGGNVYVTGKTMSPDFPTTPGALDTVFN